MTQETDSKAALGVLREAMAAGAEDFSHEVQALMGGRGTGGGEIDRGQNSQRACHRG